jgi:hypothetical protein
MGVKTLMKLHQKTRARSQNITIVAGIFIAILFVFGVASGIHLQLQGSLQVDVVPNDSTATLNGRKIATGRAIGANQGIYTLKITRNGFATQTQSVTIKNRQAKEVQIYMLSNGPVGDDWLGLHPTQAIEIEGSGSRAYDKLSAENTANNPIVTQLPLYDPRFRIDYGGSSEHPNDSSAIGIYITAQTPDARQAALQLIRDKGFDPSTMEINFETPQD